MDRPAIDTYEALIVEAVDGGKFVRRIGTRRVDDLPPGDVLVRVRYSSINYKDALSATGNTGVTRRYPHTPGIDAAGVVEASNTAVWSQGDEVLVTGFDLGMNTPGGLGGFIRVPAAWIIKKPDTLTLRACMMLGTAGFTAALALHQMQAHGLADTGEIVVSGATGGVGQCAVALFARRGYDVCAVTGKLDQHECLVRLGATEVIERSKFNANGRGAMAPSRWSGGIDTVGGPTLDAMLKSTARAGVVAGCGLAATAELKTNVYPFILRGVSLVGIDSAQTSIETRRYLWSMLATQWRIDCLEAIAQEIDLCDVDTTIASILAGTHRGRTIVRLPDHDSSRPSST